MTVPLITDLNLLSPERGQTFYWLMKMQAL